MDRLPQESDSIIVCYGLVPGLQTREEIPRRAMGSLPQYRYRG